VRQPLTGLDLVIPPLRALGGGNEALAAAMQQWDGASREQQVAWASAYGKALPAATIPADGKIAIAATPAMGPIPVMAQEWLDYGRAGAVDAALVQQPGAFFVDDWTKPMLLLEDGAFFDQIGNTFQLGGPQWGQMNEEGNWPGAWWLAPYTVWYNVPPANTAQSGDLVAFLFVIPLALLLIFLPFIPGVRSLPRKLGVYRFVWRHYYDTYGTREAPRNP
jgi:hypothetical protein